MSIALQLRRDEEVRAQSIRVHHEVIDQLIEARKRDLELIARLIDAKERELIDRDDLSQAQRIACRNEHDDLYQLLAELVNISATELLGARGRSPAAPIQQGKETHEKN